MLLIVVIAHAAGAAAVLNLSKLAGVSLGTLAAALAIAADVGVVLAGGWVRVGMAPAVMLVAGVAASKAFSIADDGPRNDELERRSSQAGMALVALTIAEALIGVVAGFVWMIN